jgi:hypothetical protein
VPAPSPRHAADAPKHASRPDPVDARRAARFKNAQARIAKIVDGSPPLTEDQLHTLALLLTGGRDHHPEP